MTSSFFGTQEGPFSITLQFIEAVVKPSENRFVHNGEDIEKGLSSDVLAAKIEVHRTRFSDLVLTNVCQSTESPWLIGCASCLTAFALYVVYRRFVPSR